MALQFGASRKRWNLYADPGMGKTVVTLNLIESLGWDQVLIVAPLLVVREVWSKEPAKWAHLQHLKVTPIIGKPEDRQAIARFPPRVCATNYEQLIWLYRQLGDNWPFRHVIFDESTRLAGFRLRKSARQANAMAQVCHTQVESWVNLTGTPNANSYTKLWGPQWFVDGGAALGRSYEAFLYRWFYSEPGQRGLYRQVKLLPGAEREIVERMKPTTCTVRARDWFDIKDPIERTLTIELPPSARKAYSTMHNRFFADLQAGRIVASNCGVKSVKLRQIASGAMYHDEDGNYEVLHTERLDALESIVQERTGQNLFVVYQFRHELQQIKARFKYAVDIHEPNAIANWTAGRIPMLLAQPRSAGHGLDLQHGGHVVVFYSPLSDRELYQQVLDRIGPVRQLQAGYDRPVFIDHIEARQTSDQACRAVCQGRGELMDAFLELMKG